MGVYVGIMSGSIRQLKNDYWLLRVDQGRDPLTGRRIQASKTVSGNRKAAERALDELKFSIRNQMDHWFANPEVEVERALAAIQRSFAAS
jgi:hypothetical protein